MIKLTKIDRLELIRIDLQINKTEYANLLGVAQNYYSSMISDNGKGNLRVEHLERLLEKKSVNPAWILSGEGPRFLTPQGGGGAPVTVEALRAVLLERMPPNTAGSWLGAVLDAVCVAVVGSYPSMSLLEMQVSALESILKTVAEITRIFERQVPTWHEGAVDVEIDGRMYPYRQAQEALGERT